MNEGIIDATLFELRKPSMPSWLEDPYVVIEAGSILIFLLLLCTLLAFFLYRWYCRKTFMSWDIIRYELEKIAKKEIKNRHDIKHAYYDLTRLIKWYIEVRYKISLLPLTDEEAIVSLQKNVQDIQIVEKISQLFHSALTIKYASYEVGHEALQHDISQMYEVVEKTIPKKTDT